MPVGLTKRFCISQATIARLCFWVAALCFTTASDNIRQTSAAELDETRARRGNVKARLTWDNITAKSGYLSGVEPKFSIKHQVSCVELAPGQCVEFFVPQHELVRVVSCESGRLKERVQIWTSDGSGMYRKHNAAATTDGCSLIAAPDESGISLAKVCRPAGGSGSVCIGLFTSRRVAPKLLDYYQCPILRCGKLVEIKDDRGSPARQYALMSAGQSKRLKVSGPRRLRIESRLKYGLDIPQRQPYWLQVYVDGVLHRVLTFTTQPNRDHRVFVDGCERLVGRREFAYLDIDCGDRVVEIQSTHDAYVHVNAVGLDLCRPNLNRSFNFPNWENVQKAVSVWDAAEFQALSESIDDSSRMILNEPIENSFLAHAPGQFDSIDRPMVDQASDVPLPGLLETSSDLSGDPVWDPYLNQQRIAHLARNNRIDHGGLRAYMWMRAIAARHYGDADFGDEISVSELASRMREHTQFKDLLPAELNEQCDLRTIAFASSRIRRPQQDATEVIVGEQHLPSAVAAVPSATVCRVPMGQEQKLTFRMPENLGASIVRVLADQSHLEQNACLMVQFDDSPPIRLTVSPGEPLKEFCYAPGNAAAALSCLSTVHDRYDSGTAGGPFAMWNTPQAITRIATAELVKPAHVETIQIWQDKCASQSLHIGLQYLDGRPNILPETAFRALNAIVTSQGEHSPIGRFAQHEINNDSLPIERLLRTNYDWFDSTIAPSRELNEPTDVWHDEILLQLHRDADESARQESWPEAIAQWTNVIRHSRGEIRRNAISARADALNSSGEEFLAQREWRGWLRYSDDPILQAKAVDRLLESAGDNQRMREIILSFAAIQGKDNLFTIPLARQFMQNGRHRFALLVLSSMQADEQNQDILLRCSYQTQWWRLFDETVAKVHDPQSKNVWMGLKELKLGRYEHAYRLLSSGGTVGARWLEHWQTGDQIFGKLSNSQSAIRLAALADWETWQSNHPGEKVWVEETAAIKSEVQTQILNLDHRGIQYPTHLVRHGTPATVQLYGPARVRLEVRLIHNEQGLEPIDDWVLIRCAGNAQRVPIVQNRPSTTTRIETDSGELAGQIETIEIDLPAGLNQFDIACESSSFLLRIESLRPEIRLPVLPWINGTSVAAVIKGGFGRHRHSCDLTERSCTDCVRMICRNRDCRSVPLSFDALPCGCQELHSAQHYFGNLFYQEARVWENRVVPTEQTVEIVGLDAIRQDALDLFWTSQHADDDPTRLSVIAKMHQLSESHPNRADVRELLDRTMSGAKWEAYRQFDSRAGVHSLTVEGWSPLGPKARTVAAMFGEDTAQDVLHGLQQLTLLMNNPQPTEIEVVLSRPRLSFCPTGDTLVILESKSRSEVVTLTDPDERKVARVTIAAGPCSLQISQANPLTHHYVQVDMNEVLPDGSVVPIDHDKVRMQHRSQTYQVATADEPLKFRIAGPALLRVDRNEDGRRSHQYLAVEGDNSYALVPSDAADSALLRIYRLRTDGVAIASLPTAPPLAPARDRWADLVVQAAYDSVDYANQVTTLDQLALRSPDLLPLTVRLHDGTDLNLEPLRNQRIGTLAVDAGFRRRDAVEEFNNVASTEQFFQTKLSRYHYDHWHDRYRATHLIARLRDEGGPTLGLIHEGFASYSLDACETDARADGWDEFQINYQAYAYSQFDGDPILDSVSSTPWSIGASARLSRRHKLSRTLHHTPGVSIFARTLSEHRNGYASGELDQDVFTQYKSDHRQGLRFSDRLVYQTCLDRRYWISPSLMTNDAELVPDNAGVQVGTDQLLGPLQFQLAYRMTSYFADNDRSSSALQNVLYLDLVLETWHSQKRRSELAFSVRNDISNNRSSIGINFVSFLNHSRGYRDFRPSSTLFRSIRQERAAKHYGANR